MINIPTSIIGIPTFPKNRQNLRGYASTVSSFCPRMVRTISMGPNADMLYRSRIPFLLRNAKTIQHTSKMMSAIFK